MGHKTQAMEAPKQMVLEEVLEPTKRMRRILSSSEIVNGIDPRIDWYCCCSVGSVLM